jgi:hypothetical protein
LSFPANSYKPIPSSTVTTDPTGKENGGVIENNKITINETPVIKK